MKSDFSSLFKKKGMYSKDLQQLVNLLWKLGWDDFPVVRNSISLEIFKGLYVYATGGYCSGDFTRMNIETTNTVWREDV